MKRAPTLSSLLACCTQVPALMHDPRVNGLCVDSRLMQPGHVFLAFPGVHVDGRMFMRDAIEKGAAAIVYEQEQVTDSMQALLDAHAQQLPLVPVTYLQEKVGVLAAAFYQQPSAYMKILGVTGTNGKTSCVYFLTQALHYLHKKAALMGTIGNGELGDLKASTHTTAEALAIQKQLYEFSQKHIDYVMMEVSSHGLDQHRVAGVPFQVAIFTNLTAEHLEYHHTMRAYAAAKARLFHWPTLKYAVINLDDPYANELISGIPAHVQIIGYSLQQQTHARCQLVLSAENIKAHAQGTQAQLKVAEYDYPLFTPLLGEFNVANILSVLGGLIGLGVPMRDALQALKPLHAPPGRLTRFGGENHQPLVFVDFAHSPDALQKVLALLAPLCQGELWCVFGCGGERDQTKRAPMARHAEHYAQHVIVTDDNPRSEDPKQIAADIMQGFTRPQGVSVIHDRARAIKHAIHEAKPQDILVIAGKGHEQYQIIGEEKHYLCDREIVSACLQDL